MQYIEETNKSVQEVVDAVKAIAPNYKFGVLHVHNPQETLRSKGLEFDNECQIIDICNPIIAKQFLEEDMSISSALPCKIAVYNKEGQTSIVMSSLVQMIDDLNPDLLEIAEEAQESLLQIIDEVK